MKTIELQSEFPCLIMTDDNQTFLNPTDIISIQSENILIYPVENRNILPFKINFNDKKSTRYRFFEIDNKTYCYLFAPAIINKKAIY